jgi:trk system potassium uptake protein TrkH
MMFIGGCAGSTGGSMKVARVFLLVKFVFSEITRLLHPQAVVPVRIGDTAVPREVVSNVVGFFIVFMLSFAAGVLILAAMGMDLVTSFGAAAATIGNIGPGLGMVGPTDNYAHVPMLGKWVLAFLMLMGRLELFTVLILFSPSFWKK